MLESAPRVLPASLHRPGEWKGEVFCGRRGYDQVPEGTVIFTTKNTSVVEPICLCCSSSHWVQRDPQMAKEAVTKALEDAGVPCDAIEAAVCSVVLKGRHLNLPPPHPQ